MDWRADIEEFPRLLKLVKSNGFIDFCDKPIGSNGLRQILKLFNGHKHHKCSVLRLSNCDFDDEGCANVRSLFKHNILIDIFQLGCSFIIDNNRQDKFLHQITFALTSSFKRRRRF